MVDEVDADRVVPVQRKSDFQFRTDAVRAAHQHRFAHPGKVWGKKAAEPTDPTQDFRTVRLSDQSLDLAFQSISKINVNARTGVGFFCHSPHSSRFRARKARMAFAL